MRKIASNPQARATPVAARVAGLGTTLAATLALAACAVSPPVGPSVVALPPKGGDYALFQQQDSGCRQNAAASTGYANPTIVANQAAAGTVVLGTVVGAGLGAALGAVAGNPGAGAAIGAGTGALISGGAAASAATGSAYGLQQQYDVTYAQCMTAAGNDVQLPEPGLPVAYGYASPPYYAPYYGGGIYLGIGPRWGGYRGGYWGHGGRWRR